jgi:hypothetical protein
MMALISSTEMLAILSEVVFSDGLKLPTFHGYEIKIRNAIRGYLIGSEAARDSSLPCS